MADILWHDINEKAPEKPGHYLVTLQDINGTYYVNTRIFQKGKFRTTFDAVVSWAEMPEPFVPEKG